MSAGLRLSVAIVPFGLCLAAAQAVGATAERALLGFALGACLAAIPRWRWQAWAGPLALVILGAAVASLALRFALDDFGYHLVWLMSAPQLVLWLKLANLWSGDEGTLLLLALIGLAMAIRLARYDGWIGPGSYSLAAAFLLGAILWDPFRPTPEAALAELAYRGMNAHLTRVWMLVHPPLVFFAYLLLVAPWGAMAEALAHGRGPWRKIAAFYGRGGWLLLSAGIAVGMWWAYEDFTYGSLWHWDPVQTAIFVAWALLTAMLHAQRRYQPDGTFGIIHPLLGLLTAAAVLLSMAITRAPALASSHRYVGETSLPLLLGIAGVLIAVLLACLALRLFRRRLARTNGGERHALIWVAIASFSGCALVALAQIGLAFWSAWLELPRPEDLKPFFETLRNFTASAEIAQLRTAFAQWDIDNFAMNRWLVPLVCLLGLAGGHYFLPFGRRARWTATLGALALGVLASQVWQPFARQFDGRGLTSGKTVALFPWLDLLLVSIGYLLIAALLWGVIAHRRGTVRTALGYALPVATIHAGIVIALIGALAATVLDSYSQRIVALPSGLAKPIDFPGGYRLQIGVIESGRTADGARASDSAFRSIAEVSWALIRDGTAVAQQSGHAVYRDERPPYSNEVGAVRLMCEMIDYRYARYLSESEQIIHPLISRGLWRDVQIWVPAVSGPKAVGRGPVQGSLPVILKVFPLMSFVWLGLAVTLLGFVLLFWWDRRPAYRPAASVTGSSPSP